MSRTMGRRAHPKHEFYVVRATTKTVAYLVRAADACDARNRITLCGEGKRISKTATVETLTVCGLKHAIRGETRDRAPHSEAARDRRRP